MSKSKKAWTPMEQGAPRPNQQGNGKPGGPAGNNPPPSTGGKKSK